MTKDFRLSFPYRLIFLFFVSVLTLLLYSFVDQYRVVGDNLLLNAQFDDQFNHWNISPKVKQSGLIRIKDGQLIVSSGDSGVIMSQMLSIPQGQLVRVSANVSLSNVIAGKKGWQKARVFLVNQIEGKSFWKQKHHLFSLAGTDSSSFYQEEFSIHPLAEKLKLGIQIPKGNGVMVVDDITVSIVEKTSQFQYFSRFLILLWGFALVWLLYPLFSDKYGRFIVLGGLFVLTLMVVPHDVKMNITQTVADIVQSQIPLEVGAAHTKGGQAGSMSFAVPISKVGHFVLFFLFSIIVVFLRKGLNYKIFLLLCGFAAMTEILQLLSIDRQPSMMDFGINVSGVLLASLLAFFIEKIKKKFVVLKKVGSR